MEHTRYAVADTHGNYKALIQVLRKAKFDYHKDELIVIGDVCDGYNETYKVVEELLKIKNLVFIIGNHDKFFLDFIYNEYMPFIWINQGGWNTLRSYDKSLQKDEPFGLAVDELEYAISKNIVPENHVKFFKNNYPYYEVDDMLFVHGGFDYPKHPSECSINTLTWDRSFLERCKNGLKVDRWKKVFIGHTSTENKGAVPDIIHLHKDKAKIINIDCGAGWKGRLCLYNIDTDKYFLSDYAQDLYKEK